jgi:hypothetical protein
VDFIGLRNIPALQVNSQNSKCEIINKKKIAKAIISVKNDFEN